MQSGVDTDTPNIGASISGQASETWAAGGVAGANIRFSTRINGSPNPATGFKEMMRITGDGTVGIFHATIDGFNPAASNILQIRTAVDGGILMETQGANAAIRCNPSNIYIITFSLQQSRNYKTHSYDWKRTL